MEMLFYVVAHKIRSLQFISPIDTGRLSISSLRMLHILEYYRVFECFAAEDILGFCSCSIWICKAGFQAVLRLLLLQAAPGLDEQFVLGSFMCFPM